MNCVGNVWHDCQAASHPPEVCDHNFTVRSDNYWAQMQIRRIKEGEFPGDPVVRTVGFRCWAHGFSDSLFGKLRPGGKMMDENNQLWVFPDEGILVSDPISHVTFFTSCYRLWWRILGHVVACKPPVPGKWWELPHGRGRSALPCLHLPIWQNQNLSSIALGVGGPLQSWAGRESILE